MEISAFFLSLVISVIMLGSAQIQESYSLECIGNVSPECSEQLKFNEQSGLAKENVTEAGLGNCASFFSRFAPPAEGYNRYMENTICSSIDYPKNWSVDDRIYDVVLTDGKSSSVTISWRPALKADNSTWVTIEDIKNAMTTLDTSIPNLANIPNLYDFQSSSITDGNYIDFQPSIKAEAVSDLGFMEVKKNLFATIISTSGLKILYILTAITENTADPSILQHMLETVRIMH